jgi:hypothetical protein
MQIISENIYSHARGKVYYPLFGPRNKLLLLFQFQSWNITLYRNCIYCKRNFKSKCIFIYYGVETVKSRWAICVFHAFFYKHKSIYARKNNKRSEENYLRSGSNNISLRNLFSKTTYIFYHNYPIVNTNCFRLQFVIEWAITHPGVFYWAK